MHINDVNRLADYVCLGERMTRHDALFWISIAWFVALGGGVIWALFLL
jgi:hypothetical protein